MIVESEPVFVRGWRYPCGIFGGNLNGLMSEFGKVREKRKLKRRLRWWSLFPEEDKNPFE